MNILDDLEKIVDILRRTRPPKVEVWVIKYVPDNIVSRIILKELEFPYFKSHLPETEEIYIMSNQDYSMEMADLLRNVNIPVFDSSGRRL